MNDKENDPWNLYFNAIRIVSGANMASKEEIKDDIDSINRIIGTKYYDDKEGDELLSKIRDYLQGKIN